MQTGRFATPFLFASFQNARRIFQWPTPMDFAYLLFLFVLSGVVLGFLLICDRLGARK